VKYWRKLLFDSSNYGKLLLLIGILITFPLMVLPFYPEETKYIAAFLIPSVISIVLGTAVCILAPHKEEGFTEWQSPLQRGSLPVMFAWCFSFLVGALPFVIAGQLSFIHALFESVSGWTTTGLSVADVTVMPRIFLFHRSFMQFCGGLGFIIMIVMLVQGKQSMNLYNAEGHPDRIMPSLKRTARTIFSLYTGFLILGTWLYWVFGMKLFDAVCHTMSALSTAGFSTQANSIGEYGSLPIEIITIVLMLIGSTNFAILLLLVKRKFRRMVRVSEFLFLIGLLLIFVPLVAFSLIKDMNMGIGDSIINSLFGIVTTFSTTGYSTMNYAQWPPFAVGLLILLMIIGGGAGSTAGGIKLSRTYLLIRITCENIRKRLSPPQRITAPFYYRVQGKTPIDDTLIKDTVGFTTCYLGVFIIGTLLLTLTSGSSLFDAMFEFASAFGTVGISNGLTNADAAAGTLIVQMIGMILGRLEIFIVFVGVYSGAQTLKQQLQKRIKKA